MIKYNQVGQKFQVEIEVRRGEIIICLYIDCRIVKLAVLKQSGSEHDEWVTLLYNNS